MRTDRSSQVEIAAANRNYEINTSQWDELVHAVDELTARAERRRSEPTTFELCLEDSWSGAPIADLDYDDGDDATKPGIPDDVLQMYRMIA